MNPAIPFLVKVTAKAGPVGAVRYQWEEWWLLPTTPPAYAVKVAGRYSGPSNLSYCPAGVELAVGDFAFARSAAGAGGLLWEVTPVPTSAAGSLASGETALAALFTLSGVGYDDTGVSVTLPANGTYFVYGQVTGHLRATMAAGSEVYIVVKVNNLNASFVNVGATAVSGASATGTGAIGFRYAGTAGEVLTLYAGRVSSDLSAVWATSDILPSNAITTGDTHLGYLRLGA